MKITVNQLAMAVNNCARITPDSLPLVPGMSVFEIQILNQYCHIIEKAYHSGWYQEEAEKIARDMCEKMDAFTWQVIRVK